MAFTTRKSLLLKVRKGNEVSWNDFYKTYKPLIMLVGGDCGLTPDEKEDLVSNVLVEIFQKDIIGKYDIDKVPDDVIFSHDPAKGRFRHYLRQIVRYQAIKIYKKRHNFESVDAEDFPVKMLMAEDSFNKSWECEWTNHLRNEAVIELKSRIEPKTYSAFEMYAFHGKPVKEVADFFDMSISSVYTAKSRCIAALREIIKDLEEK